MPKVKDVFNTLESLAPTSLALSYDNVGILVGDENASVSKILVALDITREIIDEAVSCGADLIVAHHPVVFDKLAYVTAQDLQGGRVMALIKNGISAICMHTNLDAARGGVNDALAA
ncbi:MAG: Nif3-like dinuclear metal center hexameric protein, partial [Clostridia bacterium]